MTKYIAQMRNKRGTVVFQTEPNDDREQAALMCFHLGPSTLRTCSTEGAYHDGKGWRGNGMDIRWHDRERTATGASVR
jgi:hypothetical protein